MEAFENYDWPGNLRELINILERAGTVSGGPELRLAEKLAPLPVVPAREKASKGLERREPPGLAEMERALILKTLRETGWGIEGPKGAAQFLGMNPSTLRARIRKLGIKRPSPH